jgi:hypothetical protein
VSNNEKKTWQYMHCGSVWMTRKGMVAITTISIAENRASLKRKQFLVATFLPPLLYRQLLLTMLDEIRQDRKSHNCGRQEA